MEQKYLTNVESNPLIKEHLEIVEKRAAQAEEFFKGLNAQGDAEKKSYEEIRDKHWSEIKEQLHTRGLITAEEKEFGIFTINKHKQLFFQGIDHTAKAAAEEKAEEAEIAAENSQATSTQAEAVENQQVQ